MKMKSLRIELNTYGENEGKYSGIVEFRGDKGTLGVIMSPEVTESFLALAGELLIAHIEMSAMSLQTSIDVAIDKVKLITLTPKQIAERFRGEAKMIEVGKK